jgi:membrane protein
MKIRLSGLVKRFQVRARQIQARLLKQPVIRFIVTVFKEMGSDDASTLAAALSYYAFMCLFPLLLGLIAILGLFLPSQNLQNALLDYVGNNLPSSADLVKQTISDVIRLRGALGLISIITLLWSGSSLFSAVSHAINRAWNVGKERSFFINKARELGMALSLGMLFLVSLAVTAVFSILAQGQFSDASFLISLGSYALTFILTLGIFLLLYKYIPNTGTEWRFVWPGAVVATVLFEIARHFFAFYIEHFGSYQLIYGSLGAIVILLVWIYYSAFIMLLGAEVCSELNHPCTRLEPNAQSELHTPLTHDINDKKSGKDVPTDK